MIQSQAELEIARHATILRGLNPDEVDLVIQAARVKRLEDGAFFFMEEEPAEYAYVLLEGKVKLVQVTPDGEPGLNYLCAGFKEFFHHVSFPMKIMAGLIRRGREAKEVMEILDQAFSHVHRLDPCPCGSGLKFRQCHGRTPLSTTLPRLPSPQARSQLRKYPAADA